MLHVVLILEHCTLYTVSVVDEVSMDNRFFLCESVRGPTFGPRSASVRVKLCPCMTNFAVFMKSKD